MYATNGNAQRARWQVLWVGKGKVQSKDFDHDLAGALELYVKVKESGRAGATLRCANMGFPPPVKYADRAEVIVIKNGRKFKGKQLIEPRVYRERMHGVNVKGWWWCPYCITLRKFKRREVVSARTVTGTYNGKKADYIHREMEYPHMACPMCNVPHDDANVLHYNPIAVRYNDMRKTRSDKGVSRG